MAREPSQALVPDADSGMPPRPSGRGLLEVGLGRHLLSQAPGDSNSWERLRTMLEYTGIGFSNWTGLVRSSAVSCDM